MSDHRLDKATLGLPLFLEDTTGFWQGPTDFLDIYDRPPFIHVRNQIDLISRKMRIDIFETSSRYGVRSGISLHLEPDVNGNIVCINDGTRKRVPAESWLCKCGSAGRLIVQL